MTNAKDKFKAELAEYSYLTYEKFLHNVFLDNSLDIPERNQILFYCFLHKWMSYSQLMRMFGGAVNNRAVTMKAKRLRDNKLLVFQKDIAGSSARYDDKENIYVMTAAGVKYCQELIRDIFPKLLPDETFKKDEYTFSLDMVLTYLGDRCNEKNVTYLNHYLATRDIESYLLSSPNSSLEYSFDTEVGIDTNGNTVSIFTRTLLGCGNNVSPIRSDGYLAYPLDGKDKKYLLKFFIELDTGSQRSSLVVDKVRNYLSRYLSSTNFSPLSSLLFSLQTSVKEERNKIKEAAGGYGSRDFYYSLALECTFDMLKTQLPDSVQFNTVGDAVNMLKGLERDGKITPSLSLLLKYFSTAAIANKNIPLSTIKTHYYTWRDEVAEKRLNVKNEIHGRKYLNRRNLIHSNIDEVAGLNEYLLKGFSIYTLSNHDLESTLPYLLPEMFQFKMKLRRMCLGLNLINMSDQLYYEPLYLVKGSEFVLRNSYTGNDKDFHIIIENISDDLGGLNRIKHLLSLEIVPTSLLTSKIICLIDNTSMEEIKGIYLGSKIGEVLSTSCGSSCVRGKFEIMFATYETIRSSGSLFTFSSNGEIVYKTPHR